MAEGKKSFIFYADWIDTFKALPKETGYDLLMHILSYVNDEDPETDDVFIKAIFPQMRSALKRDLVKWEKQYNQRVEAGKKSAEVRKNKRGSTKFNERSTSVQRNPTKEKSRQRNSTVNVNGNVNVNDNVINNKRSTDVDPKNFNDYASDSLFPVTELAEAYSRSENILSAVSETTGRDVEQLKSYLPKFAKHLTSEGRSVETPKEFAKYFRNKVKLDATFQQQSKPKAPESQEYVWQVRGYPKQRGSKQEYESDRKRWNSAGLFRTIKTPQDV